MERPLDPFEQRALGVSRAYCTQGVFVAHLAHAPALDALRQGLDAAAVAHPLAAARIADLDGAPRFTTHGAPPVPLRASAGPWLAEGQEELARPFDFVRGPLMRAALVRDGEGAHLLLTIDHLPGDGAGFLAVLRDVVAWTFDAEAGRLARPAPGAMPSMLDHLPPAARRRGARLRAGLGVLRMLGRGLLPRDAALPRDGDAPPWERQPRVVHHSLHGAELHALAERAKAASATVHGALCAAMMTAVAAEAAPGRRVHVPLATPVNPRPYLLGAAEMELGVHPVVTDLRARAGDGVGFWSLARALNQQLRTRSPRTVLARLSAVAPPPPTTLAAHRTLLAKLERWGTPTCAVTNMGRIAQGPEAWQGFDLLGPSNFGGPTMVLAAATYRDRLSLDFGAPEPLVAPARAQRVADRAVAALRQAASAPQG